LGLNPIDLNSPYAKNQRPSTYITHQLDLIPNPDDIEFFERGSVIVRVMDRHNFYEAVHMSEEYLIDAPIGLLTKIWISISKSLKQ
jgi:hypothetical protein